jgi:CDP-4-dehydro-6-deoxyglucose reductase, E3
MKKVILQPSGKEIQVEDGQTILSALEQGGYALPNNCRAGACGECKVKVCGGEIEQGFILDMALPQSEREQGFGLMCMAKAKSDIVEIEWGTADALPKLFPPKENMPYIVMEKMEVTPTIAKLRLRSLGEPLRFWPGQYVTMGDKDRGVPERCYSIANIPNNEGELVLYITKVPDGQTSTWVHESLNAGDRVKVNGAYGTFIGDPSAETPVLCLAAGSGLAPIASLASGALMRGGFRYPATILFSAKDESHVFDRGLFSYLETKFRNFRFNVTYTKQKVEGKSFGRIPEILLEKYPDLSNTSIYIAGSTDFVDACTAKVKELGAKDELIYTEGFISQ